MIVLDLMDRKSSLGIVGYLYTAAAISNAGFTWSSDVDNSRMHM